MTSNITSDVTIIQKLSLISYAIEWTGTSPVGEVNVEVSNDYRQNADGSVKDPGTWNTLPLSDSTVVVGNSDHGFIDIYATGGYALRLTYTRASGTGIMNVMVSGKVA